jgi:hypothetical protein
MEMVLLRCTEANNMLDRLLKLTGGRENRENGGELSGSKWDFQI